MFETWKQLGVYYSRQCKKEAEFVLGNQEEPKGLFKCQEELYHKFSDGHKCIC